MMGQSRDSMMKHTHNHGKIVAGTKGRTGFSSWSSGLRHLCILGVVFVVVVGLLSTSYLESSFERLMEQSSTPKRSNSIPIFQGFVDSAASEQWLNVSREDSGEAISSTNTLTSGDSIQEDGTEEDEEVKLPTDKSIGDREHAKEVLTLPSVELAQTQPGDVTWPVKRTVRHSEDIEVAQTTGKVQEEELEASVEILSEEQKQDAQPRIMLSGSSSVGNVTVKSEEVEGLPAEIIRLPSDLSPRTSNSTSSKGRCDLTAGKWVPEPAGPLYPFNHCRILSQPQNCQQNGRPDDGYQFYKWEPEQCVVPRLDPNAFLEMMQGKTLAFVGDSLARNQMESLMCILLQVAEAKSKGSKNMHRWYFPSHRFTIIRMWSSWLVQSNGEFPPSLAPPNITKLNLTELDDYAYHLPKFDVTILSSGHWWLRKTAYFIDGDMLGGMGWPWLPSHGVKKLDHIDAFGIAVNNSLKNIGAYPGYKGITILRTYTPDHYSGGSWDTGGSCTGETKPYLKGPENSFNEKMYGKQLQAFESNTKTGDIMPNGSKLRMLDVYPMLNLRGDGHPGPYRSMDPLKITTRDAKGRPPPQDCLHWCMPGPLDSVNELLFQLLREELQ